MFCSLHSSAITSLVLIQIVFSFHSLIHTHADEVIKEFCVLGGGGGGGGGDGGRPNNPP